MNFSEKQHGFVLRYRQELPEIGATLYRMEYEKNGADLVWLDRPDENKTFSITFKTIPQDDTGVFHILEHSVLNGSDRYPVKEPFVELLKSSLQTFLNAMTFPDKTMYPVSSRNNQDFLNLMDVYMDAVLHPLSINDPHAFLQEGWHYEMESPEDELICNGVVYSEMKGAYADPDAHLDFELFRALFPDNCYGCESGGYPESIPTLTYDNYLACHKRFYHPSNARIFLDGQVDMDAVLARLDSFLGEYDRLEVDADIPMQEPVSPGQREAFYEIDEADDGENKVLLAKGWVIGNYKEKEICLATSIITEILAGSNESPLKKALLENDLCEDVELQFHSEMQQPLLELRIRNSTREAVDEIWSRIEGVLKALVAEGLNKQQLQAVLNNLEFSSREKDFGSMPKGLCYAILSQEAWLYGGDPAQGLCFEDVFAGLRQKIDSDWYEQYIQTCLLDNIHTAQVVLLPSKTLGEERQAKERSRLAAVKAGWSEQECRDVIETFHRLRQRQNTPDTEQQLARLPQLSLTDIPETLSHTIQAAASVVENTTVLWEDLKTDGISYLTLYFSLQDIPQQKLSQVSFLARLMGHLGTQQHSALELRSRIQSSLGRFRVSATVFEKQNQVHGCTPYLAVSIAVLDSKKQDATVLLGEVLLQTLFDDTELIQQLLKQSRIAIEQDISMSGNAYASRRIGASFSAAGAVAEAYEGIEKLRWLQKQDDEFDANGAALCAGLQEMCKTVFVRERLTVNLTGEMDISWLEEVIHTIPSGCIGQPAEYELRPVCKEGFQIPAEVGFAGLASNLNAIDGAYSGAAKVVGQYLTYDYLWNAVRVKGGAYGVRLGIMADGNIRFSSYRDPNAGQTLDTFAKSGAVLRKLVDSKGNIDKYIISSIGETQPILTPRLEGQAAAAYYFSGKTAEEQQQVYTQILHTDLKQLEEYSHILDRAVENAGICVIAGKSALHALGDRLDKIESIQ